MKDIYTRIKLNIFILLLTFLSGILLLFFEERLNIIDAIYFIFVTISSVGYGDITPKTTSGKIITIIIIVLGIGSFVGLIANITDLIISKRNRKENLKKINVLKGIFFSEIGKYFLEKTTQYIYLTEESKNILYFDTNTTSKEFNRKIKSSKKIVINQISRAINFEDFKIFLNEKKNFLLNLLEHQIIVEDNEFTHLLLSIFHYLEELNARNNLKDLPNDDRDHIINDLKRIYENIFSEWMIYISNIRINYPFLYKFEVNNNFIKRVKISNTI